MSTFSNQVVFEFFKSHGLKECITFEKEQFNKNNQNDVEPTDKAFEYSVKKLIEKVERLSKNKARKQIGDELNNLLLSDFVYPKANLSKRGLQVSIDQNLN